MQHGKKFFLPKTKENFILLTSKFLRLMKYCGVSGNKMNAARNINGNGKNIFGTKK